MSNATVVPNPMAAPSRRPASLPECVFTDQTGRCMTETELVAQLVDDAQRYHHTMRYDWFVPALRAGLVHRGELPTDQNIAFWIEGRFVSSGNEDELLDSALSAMGRPSSPSQGQLEIVRKAVNAVERIFSTEQTDQLREARLALPAAIAAKCRGEW